MFDAAGAKQIFRGVGGYGLEAWQILEKALVIAVLVDLFLGGNGYLVKIAGLRLREVFYVLCLGWVVLRLTCVEPVRIDGKIWSLMALFFVVTAFGTAIGYFSGNRVGAILAELKPLSYFPMLLFFLVAIRSRADLTLVAGLLVACGVLQAVLYLLLLLVAASGFVAYTDIYTFLKPSDEFIFRHNPYGPFVGFLYKGAFYTCVAAIFLLFDPFRISKIFAAALVVAMSMTLTRGLCGALFICILLGGVLNSNWRRLPMLIAQAALLVAVLLWGQHAERELLIASGDFRSERPGGVGAWIEGRPTDRDRTKDIEFVVEHLNLQTALIGRGIGAPIRGRERIELNYLEILYKQGLFGLSVWGLLLLYMMSLYWRTPAATKQFALAFFLSGVFVYGATATNTFLTGSIGMAVVFIGMAGLLVLARESLAEPMRDSDWYGRWLTGREPAGLTSHK